MNIPKYILRSLIYYRRSHLALLVGVAVAVTVIVGALAVGDSVRKSLLQMVDQRLGNIDYVMVAGKYFPRTDLCQEITDKGKVHTAPLIALQGSAMSDGGAKKIPQVNLLGIDEAFLKVYRSNSRSDYAQLNTSPIPAGEAVINSAFAEALGINKGEVFIMRIPRPGVLPEDIALTKEEESSTSLRLRVYDIADDSFPGDFSLKSDQQVPKNIFVNLNWLGDKIERKGRSNLILAGKGNSVEQLNDIVGEEWELSDIGLGFKKILDPASRGRKVTEMTSERIFIEDNIADKAVSMKLSEGILTYFVNSITNRKTGKSCPYSFVAAVDKRLYPVKPSEDWNEKEQDLPPIVINSWLAQDLGVKKGDVVDLSYYFPGRMRKLIDKTTAFRVSDIVLIKGWSADKNMMPDFPGLADTENCSEWDPGIPINLKKVRDKDEKYWDDYRGVPKAFISLEKGQEIWKNQFGSLTAVRFQKGNSDFELQEQLNPGDFGLSFIDIGAKARFAAQKSVDFGGLFLGLSFFIIFSAFILTAMLFSLSIQSRANEISILSNLGFRHCGIRRILMIEHAIPALLGSCAGVPLGMLYNSVVIRLLNTLWQGAVGTSSLQPHVSAVPAVIGSGSGFAIALITMVIILSRQLKKLRFQQKSVENISLSPKRFSWTFVVGIAFFFITAGIVIRVLISDYNIKPSAPFFASGGLLLLASWCFAKTLFNKYRNVDLSPHLGKASFKAAWKLAIKNCTCNITRSMAAIMLLSCGIFLTLAVAINMRSAKDLSKKSSGTGGYKFFVKTSLPVINDLNTEEGRKAYGLDPRLFKEAEFVQMRLSDGNEASCLNLNRVENPAILGVDFAKFAKRKAFSFKTLDKNLNPGSPWADMIATNRINGQIPQPHGEPVMILPAVADNDVMIWIMGKKIGDYLLIQNESGKNALLNLEGGLAPSIFQGYVLVPEGLFMQMAPESSGSRVLLVDCPDINEDQVEAELRKSLSRLGVEIEKCSDRLRRFQKVENTYLSIFLVLGGLGLIIGAAGFGIIVMRNIIERREEFAIMHALGFRRSLIRKIVISEHLILILLGIVSGGVAAGISAIPAVISSRDPIPWDLAFGVIVGIILCGVFCVYVAAVFAIKKKPINALRKE